MAQPSPEETQFRVHMLILHTGYVEDCSTGSLILWHPDGFDTIKGAFTSLGQVFLAAWEENQQFLKHANKRHHCPHCNEPLFKDDPVRPEDIAEMVREYQDSIADGSHAVWSLLNHHGWQTGLHEAPKEFLRNHVLVHEYAGAILGMVATGDQGEYQDFVCDWEKHMDIPEGLTLRLSS